MFTCELLGRGRSRLVALEAFPAEDRPSLRWLEGHRGFAVALRAVGRRFDPARPGGRSSLTLSFASFATLRLILESLVVEEMLFTCREYKVGAAIYAD